MATILSQYSKNEAIQMSTGIGTYGISFWGYGLTRNQVVWTPCYHTYPQIILHMLN